MKVSKITIGRLYNLGNYEHVRYELTVEVPAGESAAEAVLGLENILRGLKPDRGAKSAEELERAGKKIALMQQMADADFQAHHCYGTTLTPEKREQILNNYRQTLADETARAEAAKTRREVAQSLFDDVGGAAEWKDAKADWDNDGQW